MTLMETTTTRRETPEAIATTRRAEQIRESSGCALRDAPPFANGTMFVCPNVYAWPNWHR